MPYIYPFVSAIRLLFAMGLLLCLSQKAKAQIHQGVVVNQLNGLPVPFVHIESLRADSSFFSDMDGYFELPSDFKDDTLVFYRHGFVPLNIHGSEISGDTVKLQRQALQYTFSTSTHAQEIVRKCLQFAPSFNAYGKGFTYQAYNKITVDADRSNEVLEAVNRKSAGLLTSLTDLQLPKHLFLMELWTKRWYKDPLHSYEKMTHKKSSGLKNDKTLAMLSHIQPLNLFQDYVRILSKSYASPLGGNPFKRYIFTMEDIAHTTEGKVYFVGFRPSDESKSARLKGQLLITEDYYLKAAFLHPSSSNGLQTYFIQVYGKQGEQRYFPQAAEIEFMINAGLAGIDNRLVARSELTIQDYEPQCLKPDDFFSEVSQEYSGEISVQSEEEWTSMRPRPLTKADKATYSYYRKRNYNLNFDRLFLWSVNLYYRRIMLGPFSLNARRLLYFNDYEGLRLGIGLETNHRFSEDFKAKAWAGYGNRDERTKMGIEAQYQLIPRWELWAGAGLEDNLYEQGQMSFQMNKSLYTSESFRRIRLRRMDHVISREAFARMRLAKNLYAKSRIDWEDQQPLYTYTYAPSGDSTFRFFTWTNTLRYRFGQRFRKVDQQIFPLPNPYPELWLQHSHAFPLLGGDYRYDKIMAKVQQRFQVLGLGQFAYQVSAGAAIGAIPLPKLLSPPGSYRNFSFVAHNSFETMSYNEFVSDRFLHVFLVYEPGSWHVPVAYSEPHFSILHNMGWGGLRRPEDHQGLIAKSMEHGYFESGLVVKRLLIMDLLGFKMGFGLGLFGRYGAHARRIWYQNGVVKLALSVGMN